MAIELTEKFLPHVDEMFATESKKSLLTNQDFSWTGAHTIKVYKVSTSEMNDYNRNPVPGMTGSRFGEVKDLDATTEEFTLKRDRSFTFAIDKLDKDETQQVLAGASALARQNREVVIPEIDSYVYGVMAENAGFKPKAKQLDAMTIYNDIIDANAELDDAEAPETGRCIIMPPKIYTMLKGSEDVILATNISDEKRARGVIGTLDGCDVIKIPAVRLPKDFGFMIVHPCATVAPVKLEDFRIHEDPPGISGALVEGRVCYDAFVLDNKKKAIYYQACTNNASD